MYSLCSEVPICLDLTSCKQQGTNYEPESMGEFYIEWKDASHGDWQPHNGVRVDLKAEVGSVAGERDLIE